MTVTLDGSSLTLDAISRVAEEWDENRGGPSFDKKDGEVPQVASGEA